MSTSNSHQILRYTTGSAPQPTSDQLAAEEPLEIRIRSKPISVTMRTPGHDEELAAGFLRSEAIITSRSDLLTIEPCRHESEGNIAICTLAPALAFSTDALTRHVFASSSCGICGKASIDAIRQKFPPVSSNLKIPAAVILALPDKLRTAQQTFDLTGGLHAAAIFSPAGDLVVLREDVGRHNALDKILGYGLLNNIPFDNHILLVSGRASFEIIQKALAARIPIIAAVSAPSTLAAQFAQESNQTLVGFLRGNRMNIYTHPQRIQFPEDHP